MSDEPADDGDSGSDAADASSTAPDEPADAAGESVEDASADASDAEDDVDSADADSTDGDDHGFVFGTVGDDAIDASAEADTDATDADATDDTDEMGDDAEDDETGDDTSAEDDAIDAGTAPPADGSVDSARDVDAAASDTDGDADVEADDVDAAASDDVEAEAENDGDVDDPVDGDDLGNDTDGAASDGTDRIGEADAPDSGTDDPETGADRADAATPDDTSDAVEDPPDAGGPGSGRARMGSRPPPGPDEEADSHPRHRNRTSPDDREDDDHPDAPGTPDDRPAPPSESPDEREPRRSAHAPTGARAPSPDETAAATPTSDDGGSSGGRSILSGGIGGSAPPDDEEMPLTEHIEEMLTRLAIVVVVASLATLAAFPLANDLIIQMWYDVHYGTVEACKTSPQSDGCVAPHVYGPLELVLTRIRVAGLAGLLVALPLGIYQTYRFMRPGLYPHERRYFLASVPFSLVLAIVGMVFAYFVLLPLLFAYFITYTQGSADLAFQLAETMNLILLMMGMLAIIFQIPLLIMLAIMMGITTRRWLERRRLYFWGLFLGVAVIFGPDPTGMAPFLLMATMVALFEGTLLLLRWTGR